VVDRSPPRRQLDGARAGNRALGGGAVLAVLRRMLRFASFAMLVCAAGCLGPSGELGVTGSVDLASGCAWGAERFGVVLESGNQSDQITMQCTDDGLFDLSIYEDGGASLTVTAMCSSGQVLAQTTVPVDGVVGSTDLGVVHVHADGRCP
jgi:hypothetical protein